MSDINQLTERVARLEGALGWEGGAKLSDSVFSLAFVLMVASIYCAWQGLGEPNHYYQPVLALMVLAVVYHRNFLCWPGKIYHWLLPILNFLSISLLLKLCLGGGTRFPFFWLKYPYFGAQKTTPKLLNVIPDMSLTWQPTDLALWSVDITVIQTLLLLLLVMGSQIGFQLFASLCAFLLLLVSIPALAGFEWNWAFPALVLGAMGLYLQLRPRL